MFITPARMSEIFQRDELFPEGEMKRLVDIPFKITANERPDSLYFPAPKLSIAGMASHLAKKPGIPPQVNLQNITVAEPWLLEVGETGWQRIDRLAIERTRDDFSPEGMEALRELGRRELTAREAVMTFTILTRENDPAARMFMAVVTSSMARGNKRIVVRLYLNQITCIPVLQEHLNAYDQRFYARVV
ncbi:MAG: hypothetical protein WC802_05220 [Patescibacteria group bacterium]|jgi:hypothetical protein